METGKLCGIVLLMVGFICAQTQTPVLQIRTPILSSIGNVVNRITDRTLGVVRGGINAVSNTLQGIRNRVGEVSLKASDLFEEIRTLMRTGIPDLGIPSLEPLTVDEIDVNLNHEAMSLSGKIENIVVRQLSKFRIDRLNIGLNNGYQVGLDITFPYVEVNGKYDIDGVVGDMFQIYGNGPFWLKLKDLFIGIDAVLKINANGLNMTDIDINIKLGGMENNFQNLMNDEEVCEIFNKAISSLAPEAVDIIWPEIKSSVEEQVLTIINKILGNSTLNNLVGRLLNIVTP